jgi:hypothetical protein
MSQDVADAGDVLPWNLGMVGLVLARDVAGSFRNDLQMPFGCRTPKFIT